LYPAPSNAFLLGVSGSSTSSESQAGKTLSIIDTPTSGNEHEASG